MPHYFMGRSHPQPERCAKCDASENWKRLYEQERRKLMKWKALLKALAVAAASGAVSSTVEATQTGGASSGKALAISAAVGALIGVAGYLKTSPLDQGKTPPTEK